LEFIKKGKLVDNSFLFSNFQSNIKRDKSDKMMKYLSIFILGILLSQNAYNQGSTYYYGGDYGILEDDNNAIYKREIVQKSPSKRIVTTYALGQMEWTKLRKEVVIQESDTVLRIIRPGKKIWRETIKRSYSQGENGLYHFIDRSGETVLMEGFASNITPLHKQDTVKSYYKKDSPKSFASYDKNKLKSNENWLKNGSKYFSDLHYFVDELPEHSNGQVHFRLYIMNGIQEAGVDLNQIAGKVTINWVVMEDGQLTGFNTVSGVYGSLSSILINLIKEMPGEWIPARVDGKAVRYYMNMPFNFIDRTESFDQLELSTGFVVWD